MEKWRNEIEEILARNPTVDRWIIRDLVWQETQSGHLPIVAAMNQLMTMMKLLFMGQGVITDAEWRERVKRSFAEISLPKEMVDDLFDRLNSQDFLRPKTQFKEATDEEIREAFGDDE